MQNSFSNETEELQYAGFFVRAAAYIIDSIIVFFGLLIVRLVLLIPSFILGDTINSSILFTYSFKDIIIYLCGALYFVLVTYYTGTTIGKKLMNLQVTGKDGKEKPSFTDILYRETIGSFLSKVILCAGYLVIGFDSEKRGFHDMLCDTRVIYKKSQKPVYQVKELPGSYGYTNNSYDTTQENEK